MIPTTKGLGLLINGILYVSPIETLDLCVKGAIIVNMREEFETDAKKFALCVSLLNNINTKNSYFNTSRSSKIIGSYN